MVRRLRLRTLSLLEGRTTLRAPHGHALAILCRAARPPLLPAQPLLLTVCQHGSCLREFPGVIFHRIRPGPCFEKLFWRDHATYASCAFASSPGACCKSHLFQLFRAGEIFET